MALIEKLEVTIKETLKEMSSHRVAIAIEKIDNCDSLFVEEMMLVRAATDQRRSEFSAGRKCARRALLSFGCRPQSILMGRWREPIWPYSFAGSISHDGRFAAALAYSSLSKQLWFSIDLIDQPCHQTYKEIASTILHPADTSFQIDDVLALPRIFSAKEAAIKIVSSKAESFIEFQHLIATQTNNGFQVFAPDIGINTLVRTIEVDGVIVSLGLAVED